jgi:hypothetical protein
VVVLLGQLYMFQAAETNGDRNGYYKKLNGGEQIQFNVKENM